MLRAVVVGVTAAQGSHLSTSEGCLHKEVALRGPGQAALGVWPGWALITQRLCLPRQLLFEAQPSPWSQYRVSQQHERLHELQ